MDYISIQDDVIQKYGINLVENSKCWRRMHAHSQDGSRRICKWKSVNSYVATFDLLHEIGHIETTKSSMKRCEMESEATKWAIKKMKEYNLPIKRKTAKVYKNYIAMTYKRGVRRGLTKKVKSKLYM